MTGEITTDGTGDGADMRTHRAYGDVDDCLFVVILFFRDRESPSKT